MRIMGNRTKIHFCTSNENNPGVRFVVSNRRAKKRKFPRLIPENPDFDDVVRIVCTWILVILLVRAHELKQNKSHHFMIVHFNIVFEW